MEVTTGRFAGHKNFVGPLPTHGVYRREDWELLGAAAHPCSLHRSYERAVDAAAQEGLRGRPCIVVCFDYTPPKKEERTPLIEN